MKEIPKLYQANSNEFSQFFRVFSTTQKKKIFEEAAKEANRKQREVIKKAKFLEKVLAVETLDKMSIPIDGKLMTIKEVIKRIVNEYGSK